MAGSGGAWKVAYADFVTAMMALFLVLWLVSQDTSVREAVERAFRSQFVSTGTGTSTLVRDTNAVPVDSIGNSKNSDSPLEASVMSRMIDQLQSLNTPADGATQPVKLDITPEGLEINVFDRAKRPLFVGETENLTMYGRWVFSTLAWPIAENRTTRIEIAGHTPTGYSSGRPDYTCWELSADRAKMVRRVLEKYGVKDGQISRVTGFGDSQPMRGTKASSEENRRVTVLIRLPSALEASQGIAP